MGWADLYEDARKSYGAYAVRRAPDVGLTPRAVRARASRERWRQPHPGVVMIPGSVWDHRAAIAAAQQHLGERAAAGGMSAAWLYGMVAQPPPVPHLVVPHGLHLTTPGVAIRRSRHVSEADRAWLRGLSTVTVPFLMASLAAHMPTERLRALALDARQRRVLDIVDVAGRLEEMPRIPGRGRLIQVLKELDADGGHAAFAFRVRQRLHDEGFAPSSEPVPVTFASGQTVHLDIAFSPERVAIECRGFLVPRRQQNRDVRREQAFTGEWLVLDLTWDRFLHDWHGFVGELRAALETRSPGIWGGVRPIRLVGAPRW